MKEMHNYVVTDRISTEAIQTRALRIVFHRKGLFFVTPLVLKDAQLLAQPEPMGSKPLFHKKMFGLTPLILKDW